MNNIENELKQTLLKQEKKFADDSSLIDLIKSSNDFKKMIKLGLAKKRGFNLSTVEDKHFPTYDINDK